MDETTELQDSFDKADLGDAYAEELTKIAARQLGISNKYKEPLITKWKKFEDLKAGNIPRKLRSQFNVALPVFSGMLDTLAADFDEPIELRYKSKHPSDYFKAKKIQATWDIEKAKYSKEARWDFKARVDKSLNILHGRSILKEYAYSDPKYTNVLDNVDPLYFHCQPQGGGLLENHLFAGEEGILRSESELKSGEHYNPAQVKKLLAMSGTEDYIQANTEWNCEKLQRFQAIGLDPQSNSYVGEKTFNLVEWVLTHKGKRWYVLFDPWTQIWVRCEPLVDIFSKNLYPWVSWATHEDNKVFWTPGYADMIYPVADAVVTLYNQELTNREKRNLGARFYDKSMITDVAKLDEASYRPDALVPVETFGGTREISKGVFTIETPELQGTISLLDWTNKELQKDTGVNDISQGSAMNAAKKVNIAYMESAAVAKRLGLKSQSYTECWGEIGVRFVQGLKDHMSQEMQIEVLGDMGIEPDVLTRKDVDLKGDIGVEIISSTAQKSESEKKKQGRIKMYELLAQSKNINSEMRDAGIMKDVGELSEEQIKLFLDTRNYSSRESVAKAHIAIQEMLAGDEPEINYAADATFLKIILDYSMDHRNKLGREKFKMFAMYLAKHAKLAMQNGQRNGAARGMQNARSAMMSGQVKPGAGGAPRAGGGVPSSMGARPAMPMGAQQPEQAQVAQ